MDTSLKEVLGRLEKFWAENDFPLLSRLAPGVDVDGYAPVNFSGVLPDDLRVLYGWRNGILPEYAREPIGRQTMFDGGIPLTMESVWAVQGVQGGDEDLGWNRSRVPIFRSGGGEYYLLECDASSAEYGQVIFFDPGSVDFELMIGMYDSLGTLFQSVLSAYEGGIFRVGEKGYLEVTDYDALSRMNKEMNPRSGYWGLYE